MSKYKYWFVSFGADCTETGVMMSRAQIRTVGSAADPLIAQAQVCDFCYETFGRRVEYVQGVSPVLGWDVRPSNREEWESVERPAFRACRGQLQRLSLSIGHDGKFTLEMSETNPTQPPKPTYEDLEREIAELKARTVAEGRSQ